MTLSSIKGEFLSTGKKAIDETIKYIKSGKIVAIKGIGGYHLACDAMDEDVVQRLRQRKKRPNRPLAIMAGTVTAVEKVASFCQKEIELLHSPEAPIVVLKKKRMIPFPRQLHQV